MSTKPAGERSKSAGCCGIGMTKQKRWTRREVLTLGAACGFGLSLPDLLRAQSTSTPSRTLGRARSLIVLYLHGGHAQQETWDPKPGGPLPERGEFGAIATSVTGTRFSELLPRSAAMAHKLAII